MGNTEIFRKIWSAMYDNLNAGGNKSGKNYFFSGNSGQPGYDDFQNITKKSFQKIIDGKSIEIQYPAFAKLSTIHIFQSTINTIIGFSNNPLNELGFKENKVTWNLSIDVSRGMSKKGMPAIAFYNHESRLLAIMSSICEGVECNQKGINRSRKIKML